MAEYTQEEIAAAKKVLKDVSDSIETFVENVAEDKNCLYVFCFLGIGDYLMAGGFCEAIRQRKGKERTVLVTREKLKNSGIIFPMVDETIGFGEYISRMMVGYFHNSGNYEGDNFVYGDIRKQGEEHIWDETLCMVDRLKKDAYKIPLDAPYIMPIVSDVPVERTIALRQQYILDKDRTIVLAPHARTFKRLEPEFWVKMAEKLLAKNYIVYTNAVGNEEAIEGTQALSLSFAELNYIVDKVKCFVGLSSGLFNFLSLAEATVLSIVPVPHWYWDLSLIYPNAHNRSFYDLTPYVDRINEILKKYEVTATDIKITTENTTMKNLYHSREEMLDAIVDAVEEI